MSQENATSSPSAPPYEQWDLSFVLPNLISQNTTPFESRHIAIVHASDPRLAYPEGDNRFLASKTLISRFVDYSGNAISPYGLIVKQKAPTHLNSIDAIRSFRNIAAISTVIPSRAESIAEGRGRWQPLFSDYFTIYPLVPSRDNRSLVTVDAPLLSFGHAGNQTFQPHPALASSTLFPIHPCRRLWRMLLCAWQHYYARKEHRIRLTRLFRALDIAFHAMAFPSDGMTGLFDVGVKTGLWVSAFETLLYPPKGQASKEYVISQIELLAAKDTSLRQKRYVVSVGRPARKIKTTFSSKLYDQLFFARNKFFHGDDVKRSYLYYGKISGPREINFCIAPLFGLCLRAVIQNLLPETRISYSEHRGSRKRWIQEFHYGFADADAVNSLESALIAVRDGQEDDE